MTIPLLIALTVLSFIGYHLTFFSYCAYIFNVNKFPKRMGVLCGSINLAFWLVYMLAIPVNLEPLMIVLYAFLLLLETKLVFKTGVVQMLFIGVTFTINLFAKRLALLAIFALFNGGLITDVFADVKLMLLVGILSFVISIQTISVARKMIPRNSLDIILADNKNISFLTAAFSILLTTLFMFQLTLSVDGGSGLLIHYAVLGALVIAAFAIFIVFAFFLAELRIQTETYKRLSRKNTEDLENLKGLEQEAIKDTLTGLYTRDFADDAVQRLVTSRSDFFVAFIDLDGLKIVNDIHGHEEGDFYIQTVAETLTDYFTDDLVCRYGGDEMVIVGQYRAGDEVTKRLIWCYNAVANIPKQFNKKYSTSISYGVAFKRSTEMISAADLIAIADARMYELKKSNKKHRKVVQV